MEILLVRKEEQVIGTWAGGTTTQLAIWPPESDYRKRDFAWRLSSARVDLEESVFTSLPGYHRLLMILEGSVRLIHETPGGQREAVLSAFEQDAFEGDWKTTSYGRCVDFNLMTAQGCSGVIEPLKKRTFDLFAPWGESPNNARITEAFYCLRSGVQARVEGEGTAFEAALGNGDFLMFSSYGRRGRSGKIFRAAFENLGDGDVWGIRAIISCRRENN